MAALRIHLLFFAVYRDLAGTSELELELPAGATAASAVAQLRGRGGALAGSGAVHCLQGRLQCPAHECSQPHAGGEAR